MSNEVQFLMNVLQATDDSGADPEAVYPLLAANIDKLNATFVEVLRRWATDELTRVEPDQAQDIASNILSFSSLIQQFPLGDRANNIEIAIAGYEMALIVFTRDEFPEDWADVQSNMGTAYRDRVFGDTADNIEKAIKIHTAVLKVRTRGSEEWAGTQMNLGAAYLGRIAGNTADNIEQAIVASNAAKEVFTHDKFPQQWVMIQSNLVIAYRNRILGKKADNIEKAIKACTEALEVCSTRNEVDEQWAAMAQTTLGNAYFERIYGNRADNLEEAIKAYTAALEFYTRDEFPQQWALVQSNLGGVYRDRIHGKKADNIEKAITACNAALEVRTRSLPQSWAETQTNLGNAYSERILGEKADNVDKAIAAYTDALKVYTHEKFPQQWATVLTNLGNVYRDSIFGDKADNIEKAIAACTATLEVLTYEKFPQLWATMQMDLGNAYSERIIGDEAKNFEKAIVAYTDALKVYTRENFPQQWAMVQTNLGSAYWRNRTHGDETENVEQAIAAYKAALKICTQNEFPQQWAMVQTNLGIAYSERILGDKAENIEQALTALTNALNVFNRNSFPQDWALVQNNLGIVYSSRGKYRDKAENMVLAFQAYSDALEVRTRDAFPINHVETKYNLGILYQDGQRFTDAYTTFKSAIETVELLREEIVSGDETKRKQAEKWNQLYRSMVEVCIAQNNIAEAIEYVERSKTRTLVELILERDFKTIFSSEDAKQLEELRDKIASGQNELQNRTAKNPKALAQNLQEWRQQRNDLQNSKLSVGYSFNFDKFQKSLDEGTTIIEWYITGTSKTAFETFIITHNSLQWFNVSSEADERNAFANWLNEYGEAYNEKNKWQKNLSSRLNRLAEILHLEDILKQVPDTCSRLVLIPHMFLHIFPLHALPLANGDFLCDRFSKNVSYAPSCQLLQQLQPLQRPEFQRLFAVQTPTKDLYEPYEKDLGAIAAIKKQFNNSCILKKAEATKSEIYCNEELFKANCIFFFCHGYFNPDSPLDSGLQLADENLTLKDIIVNFKLNNCRLVMLSACETGLPDFMNTSDEYIGLPYGFLLAGSTNVVSSLWTVSANATALLMIKFYEELQQQNNIAVALNTAQRWLRDTTVQEFRDWLVQSRLEKVWQRQLDKDFNKIQANQGATVKPFEQPYYWAAFCAIGKGV
ncbi:CHAT domain-containing protein [Scytonema sp. UIC 10036]|uniref:CHAT domain-containing protein n=1 Tax=Scytonema sp. UIC 10036 TaxID=2304196 RepID=UPI0012DAC846|nr:CHAT domain-containing tetratricopeptide repeat protein [Scytonema sp. UIC 10036]MUG91948.1 CHAT domain-containing protein [Scytonema sp. UIC 10036]